jgi:NAD(P)-dependent dehydrogenase (short-subunit alcohol dehydrogenase family)
MGRRAMFVRTDVSVKVDAQKLAKTAADAFGRIDIISRAAFKPRVGVGAYSAAKGAILAMSRVLAAEVARSGIVAAA